MHVIELMAKEACAHCAEVPDVTTDDLQRIYDLQMAERIIARMLDAGLITPKEAKKLSQRIREMFPSCLSDLFA